MTRRVKKTPRRWQTALVVAALAAGMTVAEQVPTAGADTAPPPGTPATVSADALPTVQQNGVVWSEAVVGNTVYATGSFSETWPAGKTNTSANDTPRANLLAFDITTGNLITSFNHSLNAQGLVVTASPDGTRVYVGGDFTTVDGLSRSHIAAFSTASGALLSTFAPSIGATVEAITADNNVVYAGGNFFSVNGVSRTRLAALTAATGALTSWAPKADDNQVAALALSPDGSRVIVGGRFTTLNGVNAYGLGAVSTSTGATLPFAIDSRIRDYGNNCGILSLTTDSTTVYGSGFSYGCGNFEGTFAADPDTGNIRWINDCHGDTYGTWPVGQVLYSVSHAHDCSAIGAFPDTNNPRVWHHALAFTTTASGTNKGPDVYGWNYNGVADSTLLHWYPSLGIGSYTGQYQAAWAVTGNSNYLALGGEFPTANGLAQQGLVRYAISTLAPNKIGPVSNPTALTPVLTAVTGSSVRVGWQSTWDYDNNTLTYQVFRDGATTPVFTTTAASNFWQSAAMEFLDTGLAAGSTHSYVVRASDAFHNVTSGSTASITIVAPGPYASDVLNDGANHYWRLGETSGTAGIDTSGGSTLTEGSGVGHGAAGALVGDSNTASTFDGTSAGSAATTTAVPGPNTFSIEAWFKTTSTSGGKIIGFGNAGMGSLSSSYDRHLYLDTAGRVVFGVYNNATYTVTSPTSLNDGQWHYVVGTLSGTGLALYVDGQRVGTNGGTTIAQNYSGFWRIGGDNLAGWPGSPASNYLNATIDEVATYQIALSAAQISQHYADSGH